MEKIISEKPLTLSWERVPPQRRVWGGTESNLAPPLLPQGIPCPLCLPRVAPQGRVWRGHLKVKDRA